MKTLISQKIEFDIQSQGIESKYANEKGEIVRIDYEPLSAEEASQWQAEHKY